MSSGTPSSPKATGSNRRMVWLWAAIIGLIFGVIEFGQPLEDVLRTTRNAMHARQASGDIVIVAIDNKSLEAHADWPWPRQRHAGLIDELNDLGAAEIAFDIGFSTRTSRADDRELIDAINRAKGKVVLPIRSVKDAITDRRVDILPSPELRRQAALANIYVQYNFQSKVWKLEYAADTDGVTYPSLAAHLADRTGRAGEKYTIDYSTRLDSIPVISAADLLAGKVERGRIAGKRIIIGATATEIAKTYFVPGTGQAPEVYLHVLGAETLRRGTPVELGWLMPLVATLGLLAVYQFVSNRWIARVAVAGGFAIAFILPFAAEARLVFFDSTPAMTALLIVVCNRWWSDFRQSYKARGLTNPVSGLPNLNALREVDTADMTLVVTRVHNFAEITSALAHEAEKILVEQIVARLGIGFAGATFYQGDEGIFAWLVRREGMTELGDQLEALHALCRTPVSVAGVHVDLVVTFGADAGDRALSARIGSALIAADEAKEEGLRWKEFDPAKLKDAAWKLSLLGRIDSAIDSGEMWVAYQPKLDLATRRIIGAEALVRWSHPEKGEISPAEFIPAAEQANRIEKLTAHVLDDAVRAAAAINGRGVDFDIAVNLSARLLDGTDIVDQIRDLLAKHRLPANKLTLEVTESAAMVSSNQSFEVLEQLRAVGVNIAIDDYGTGFSTLEYLKKIPATEIKIDRGFVRMIDRSHSDKLMVNSTIQLAHSLGRKVVAEGVESEEILEALAAMGCDDAQGYLIGRPMKLRALIKQLILEYRKIAA
ncbi:EAL domain-containing protein [Sphingoaurantiacus capsulatus]|uniref:EAL domain-containing protein n=1 Tax=Sphingoaurantiacus capsulatus TaxID=1771310 RepID=A0ABV7X9Y0_9SPHN